MTNNYSVVVSYTEATMDHPFVACKTRIELCASNEEEAKEYALLTARCYSHVENPVVSEVTLIEEDVESLKVDHNGVMSGLATKITIGDGSVAIVARNHQKLEYVLDKLGLDYYNKELVVEVQVGKTANRNFRNPVRKRYKGIGRGRD